jgi:ClpP class serine protease
MWWYIEAEAAKRVRHAYQTGFVPTAEQMATFAARDPANIIARRTEGVVAGPPRGASIAGNVMEIKVEGVLTKSPDIFMWFFGIANTAYRDIISALALAKSDDTIKSVVLSVDSPGGMVEGLFDTLAALEDLRATKQMSVKAANAQSAAYAIATVAGKIEARNQASTFGSIGVAAEFYLDETIVTLTNTDSPDKRPDLSTDEGRAVVVEYLDAVNELFVDAIARGRGGDVSKDDVKKEYGRGATLLAGEAKKRGMIDNIAKPTLRAVAGSGTNASAIGGEARRKVMTEEELRAQHPALYEAVFNKGKDAGCTAERKRVIEHVDSFEVSGDQKTTFEAIKNGEPMTHALMLKHLAASKNRRDIDDRQSESDAAGAAAAGANQEQPAAKDMGDLIMARDLATRGQSISKGV